MKNKYDICVISFSDIRFDGRTKNLIDCLTKNGQKVLLFSVVETIAEKQFDNVIIEIPQNRRVAIKLLAFHSTIKRYIAKLDCKVFWIADFYSLPVASHINKNSKIFYDSREIYTKLAALHSSPIKQKVASYLEHKYIKSVHTIVTSGKRDSDYLRTLYKLSAPIYEIYNYPKYKKYVKSNIIREKLNIPAKTKILLYQGILLEGRGIVPVINAMKELCNGKHDDYVFVVLGEGEYKNHFIEYAKKLNVVQNVYFPGNINYEELHAWTCAADIGLCNIEPISYSYKLALPNKLFEYMLAELPVIATDLPALSEILNKTKCGKIISEHNNTSDIVAAILCINNELEEIKDNVRKVKYNYVYETQHEMIMNIVKNDAPAL